MCKNQLPFFSEVDIVQIYLFYNNKKQCFEPVRGSQHCRLLFLKYRLSLQQGAYKFCVTRSIRTISCCGSLRVFSNSAMEVGRMPLTPKLSASWTKSGF